MFGKNHRTVTIDPSVYEHEAEERRARERDAHVASVRQRQAAFDAAEKEKADRRRQLEIDQTEALRAKQQQQAQALQNAQAAWAARRNELRDQVAALRTEVRSAQDRMETAPMDEAVRAAGERQVFERRLLIAERDYAAHMQLQPA